MPNEIFGPTGLLVGALLVIGVLWRVYQKLLTETLKDALAERDKAMAIAADSTAGNLKMGNAWEARNLEDRLRGRQGDS